VTALVAIRHIGSSIGRERAAVELHLLDGLQRDTERCRCFFLRGMRNVDTADLLDAFVEALNEDPVL
jgi:hypothetical protein